MILAAFVAASLAASPAGPSHLAQLLPVSIDRAAPGTAPERNVNMSIEQKDAAMRPLVSSATECIARTVSADPRFHSAGARFNDLIVESVPSCVEALRSMIDAYDRLYGAGAGESFFVGPYLDSLPEAVSSRVKSGP